MTWPRYVAKIFNFFPFDINPVFRSLCSFLLSVEIKNLWCVLWLNLLINFDFLLFQHLLRTHDKGKCNSSQREQARAEPSGHAASVCQISCFVSRKSVWKSNPCSYCPRSYSTRQSLQVHVSTHHRYERDAHYHNEASQVRVSTLWEVDSQFNSMSS